MLAANEKITMRQLQVLIVLSAMGTGLIVLPRRVAEFAGQDGWIITLGLMVLGVLAGLLIATAVSAATKKCPNAGFMAFAGVLLTRPVAYTCGVVLWLKLVLSAGLELRVFIKITQAVMLPKTPVAAVSAVMLCVCAYAAAKGIETRARVAEILFAVMALPFAFLVVLALFNTDFTNLQPVLAAPPQDLLQGTLRLGFVFTGLECLLLVSPFVRNDKHLGRHVAGALGFAGAVIVFITVLTIAKFGRNVVNQPWPVLRMMDMINIPGSFIARQEALMFSFWIITTFAIGNMMLFFGGLLVKDIFKPRAKHLGLGVTVAAVFAVSMLPWEDVYVVLDFMYLTAGVFFLVILPVLLLVAAKLRKRKAAAVVLLLLVGILSFTGCWDRVEVENRAFVVAIGIDNDGGEYTVSISVPLFKKDDDENSEKLSHVKAATGNTVVEAMHKLDDKTNKTLYYGQMKTLVLGEGLLENAEMTGDAINAIKNMQAVDLGVYVLAAKGDAGDVLEAKPPDETLPGLFVAEICRDKGINLLQLSIAYEDGVMIPQVAKDTCEGAPLKLDGTVKIVAPSGFRTF